MTPELPDLVRRAAALVAPGGRALVGIAGPPGAGKSTLAAALVEALAEGPGLGAVLVPMDGFHLSDDTLDRLGRRDRKGAPDTFDADGYVRLLRRLRDRSEPVVRAPRFDRTQERSVPDAVSVPREVPLVVTEGSYLLGDDGFAPVRDLLDETWFVEVEPDLRRQRLVARHVRHGRSPAAAAQWVRQVDEPNAALVAATRPRADLVVRLD